MGKQVMGGYILRRLVYMVIIMALVSVVAFLVIQLPPGDYLTATIVRLRQAGTDVSEEMIEAMVKQYGLDLPVYRQYLKWISGWVRGDFGYSFEWKQPVRNLIGERLALTWALAITTLVVTYLVGIPIGIYSARHQYSVGDYVLSVLGFVGLATPNFMLALILMFVGFKYFGMSVGGLFSPQFLQAPWSWARIWDLIKHLPAPVIVIGTAGIASVMRVMRGTLLDELQKQYVITARAKGVDERKLLFKYPVRVSLNPMISWVAAILPNTISGGTITAIVFGLPTAGPLLFRSLISQDVYLSASILMFVTFLTVIGSALADVLLALNDPRIRLEKAVHNG